MVQNRASEFQQGTICVFLAFIVHISETRITIRRCDLLEFIVTLFVCLYNKIIDVTQDGDEVYFMYRRFLRRKNKKEYLCGDHGL